MFQLRLGLSPLRYHKIRHNFADTPSASCVCNDGIENVNHFLFHCTLYSHERVVLLNIVENVTSAVDMDLIQNLAVVCLYGHASLSDADNRNILLSTIKFIKDSKRFSG